MNRRECLIAAAPAALPTMSKESEKLPGARPVPALQAVPQPAGQISLQHDGREITRFHYHGEQRRPFLFPVTGPSGRSLTRMGHPHATFSHSHHNSFWISHHDLNGEDYWGDTGSGRILTRWIARLDDSDEEAAVYCVNHWVGKDDHLNLIERRGIRLRSLGDGAYLLILNLQLQADKQPARFGKTPFGLVAARMAKSIGVNDGGGAIRSSEGGRDEAGANGVFWKRARWVDYSGPSAPGRLEGLTLMDHPRNPPFPSHWHVRNDGWMGCSFSFEAPFELAPERSLRLDYGLYIHGGMPSAGEIDTVWNQFSRIPSPADLPDQRK